MNETKLDSLASRAEQLYADSIRQLVERDHLNKFVAIEPDSGRYFVGDTISEAMQAARAAIPGCLAYCVRVGHKAAVHLGASSR